MPPPQLSTHAPVLDILHPMAVAVLELRRMEGNCTIHNVIQRRLCKPFHLQEPLQRQSRFNDRICPFRSTNAVGVIFRLDEVFRNLQHLRYLLPRIKSIHTIQSPTGFVKGSVRIENIDAFQIVLLAQVVIIDVMSRSHFKTTGSKFPIDIIV